MHLCCNAARILRFSPDRFPFGNAWSVSPSSSRSSNWAPTRRLRAPATRLAPSPSSNCPTFPCFTLTQASGADGRFSATPNKAGPAQLQHKFSLVPSACLRYHLDFFPLTPFDVLHSRCVPQWRATSSPHPAPIRLLTTRSCALHVPRGTPSTQASAWPMLP